MPMYGLPAGLLAFAGAGSGASQGGFGGALGGALQAFGNAEAAQADRADRELQGLIDITRLQHEISGAEQERAFVRSLPQSQQALASFAPGVVAKQQAEAFFQEPDQGTSLMQNLAAAGMQPGTPEYQQAVMQTLTKPQVQITQGPKLPTNHQWRDPNDPSKGVRPIAGSPADPSTMTTEQRNKAASARKTHKLLTGQVADYARALQKGIPITGKERVAIGTKREQIKLQLKNLYELGAITGPDEEILNRILVDPLDRSAQFVGGLPGTDSLQSIAIDNLGNILQEADRALDAALSGGAAAQQTPAQPQGLPGMSPSDLQNLTPQQLDELEAMLRGG